MRNTKNILQHELIGLIGKIVRSSNQSQTGIEGKIIDETMKTIMIKNKKGSSEVMKKGTVFRIDLNGKNVDVDGNFLVARPEDRIKKKTKKW